jgi:curved DNA-binding protein CbpA
MKAIFFESGSPVFAISNLATEQIDQKLIREGLVTVGQIEHAKAQAAKPNQIGQALVKMRLLSESDMRKATREMVLDIIISLFEWNEGEYSFDEKIRASHDVKLDATASDIILECARRASSHDQFVQAIAPEDGLVVRAKSNGGRLDSGKLMPVESYVLSRIESPTSISEVGSLSGIPDDDAQRAVCALLAAGFLKPLDDQKDPVAQISDESMIRFREDVARKLHFFSTADYYEILEITKQATANEVKAAYYQLAKKYHPDRYRQPEYSDLRSQLETLFTKITQAYDTLREPASRAIYEDKMKKAPKSAPAVEARTPATRLSEGVRIEAEPPRPVRRGSTKPLSQPDKASASSQPSKEAALVDITQPPRGASPTQTAEHYFQQGRARFDRKEYHAAVHLLREAIKLDASKPQYHFHLGNALMRNPRTRREAEQHLTKAAELDPINPQVRVKLGQLYKEAGLPKKAEFYFRQAVQLDPNNRTARKELGQSEEKKDSNESTFGSFAKKLFRK